MPPVDPEAKIPCPTTQHLQAELDDLQAVLDLGEREDTWEKMERAIIRFAAITRGGGYKLLPLYVEGVGRKGVGLQLAACMLSDKGRLSGVAVDLLQTLAPRLGSHFAPLVSLYLDSLVKLLGRPNKVFLRRAEKCLSTIISHCHLMSILIELRRGLNDDAASCRRGCGLGFELIVTQWDKRLFNEKGMAGLEDAVKKMATDKDPEVRATGKKVWTAFRNTWPERLDDFSAPLTPTVRRYLGIAAPGAGPSKPKMPAAARVPALTRSAGPGSSSVTSVAPAKPQPARVAALASKPVRTAAIKAVPSEAAASTNAQAGPSRRYPSPVLPPETISPTAVPAHVTDVSTSLPSSPNRPNARPPLTAQGRSVSHNVLPQPSSLAPSPEKAISEATRALGNPSRPILSTSASCTALPDSSTAPPRRFAPPARILRPMPTSEEEGYTEAADGYLITPSGATVLRNPQRPQQGERWVGLGKRPMGHAQRRVVTAPGSTDVVVVDISAMGAKTPGLGKRTLSRTINGNQEAVLEEDEEDDTPKAVLVSTPIKSAAAVPLPPSPLVDTRPPVDSPAPSVGQPIDQAPADVDEDKDEGGNMLAVSATEPLSLQAESASSAASSTESETIQTPATLEIQEEPNENERDLVQVRKQSSDEPVAQVITHPVTFAPVSLGAPPTASTLASSTSTRSSKPSHPSESATRKPSASANAAPRKPPVPSARTTKPVAIERKAFKPTSRSAQPPSIAPAPRAAKPPVPLARTAIQPSTGSKSAATSKHVPPPAKALSASSSSTSRLPHEPAPKVPLTKAGMGDKPVDAPKPAPKIGHSLTAPTKASLQRAATATHYAPAPAVPKVAPPPPAVAGVKKDRVKLKAPLPSFRPTRGAAFATKSTTDGAGKPASRSVSGSSLAASTTSFKGAGQAKHCVAKVNPESVPLPISPAEKAKLPPQAIPLPRSPLAETTTLMSSLMSSPAPNTPQLRGKGASPVSVAARYMSPSPVDISTGLRARVRTPQFVPTPLPSDKLVDVPSPAPVRPGLNALGLPAAPDSTSKRSIISHASTEPPASPNGSEDDDDLSGVTFKEHTGRARVKVLSDPPLALPLPVQTEGEMRDLMEFSAPTRTPAKKLLDIEGKTSTPSLLGTPRMALMVRDANALTPGGMEVE